MQKMSIAEQSQKAIDYVNLLTYEQYDAGWCKIHSLSDIQLYGSDDKILENFQKNPQSHENCLDLVQIYLNDTLTLYTPERFMYTYLSEADWQLSETNEHLLVANQIAERSLFFIEKQKQEKQVELLNWLAYWGLNSLEEHEEASIEVQQEVDLPQFYQNFGFTPEGGPWLDFTDYPWLKSKFLQEVFNPSTVRFFVNIPLKDASRAFDIVEMPAVVGLDTHTIGVFWFND